MTLSLQNVSLDTLDNTEKYQMVLIDNDGLSKLEEDVISCMVDLKEYMESYDDEMVSSGIALRHIVNVLKPISPEMDAVDLW